MKGDLEAGELWVFSGFPFLAVEVGFFWLELLDLVQMLGNNLRGSLNQLDSLGGHHLF
jgi:hypothetical protein